jgi:hypothetical protein
MKTNYYDLSPEQKEYARKVFSDPVLFAHYVLGVSLWEREAESYGRSRSTAEPP